MKDFSDGQEKGDGKSIEYDPGDKVQPEQLSSRSALRDFIYMI